MICHLFRTSLSCSTIPQDWRTHCVIPIYKSGDKISVSNYRPISLLCILSKVMERLVYNNIIDHVQKLSTKCLFGFLPKRSTLQQLLVFAKNVLEPKCEVDVVYMDFRKAFDTVSHDRLLQKLWAVGITGTVWKWFQAYLKQRYQRVKVGDSFSDLCNVLSGVPQGSVLGPLLFVIFINDLPEHIQFAIPFIFADDTKCLCKIRSSDDTEKLQTDINNAFIWSITSELFFNYSKFVHLRFWAKDSLDHSIYSINGQPIPRLSHHKDLGVIFTCDFNWTAHYSSISAKAYKILGLIRRTFKTNCMEAKKNLYISLVRSQLIYCSQMWRPQLIKDITSLERIQRRATKYILNDYTSTYKSRLEQLNLLPLMYIYEINDLMFLIKSLKSPSDNFEIRDHITFTSNSTRSGTHHKLTHPRTTSAVQRHFYFNRITRLYNYLPAINISLPTNIIKCQLIQHLWTHFYNNFNSDRSCTFHLLCPCHRCSSVPISVNFNEL